MKLELAVADWKDCLSSWKLEDKTHCEAEKIFSSQPLLKTSSFDKTKPHGHASEPCRCVSRPLNHLLDHAICIPEAINGSLILTSPYTLICNSNSNRTV